MRFPTPSENPQFAISTTVHALARDYDDEDVVPWKQGLFQQQRPSLLTDASKKDTSTWTRKELSLLVKLGMGTIDLTSVGVGKAECLASRLYCNGCYDANKLPAIASRNSAHAACRRREREEQEAQALAAGPQGQNEEEKEEAAGKGEEDGAESMAMGHVGEKPTAASSHGEKRKHEEGTSLQEPKCPLLQAQEPDESGPDPPMAPASSRSSTLHAPPASVSMTSLDSGPVDGQLSVTGA
jgi:hypothetical protein